MPKLKTNRGAAKRFKKTGNGGFKYRQANRNHILTKKSTKRMRRLRGMKMIKACDAKSIVQMLAGS
jgi:large subunit ribosomal protein L35